MKDADQQAARQCNQNSNDLKNHYPLGSSSDSKHSNWRLWITTVLLSLVVFASRTYLNDKPVTSLLQVRQEKPGWDTDQVAFDQYSLTLRGQRIFIKCVFTLSTIIFLYNGLAAPENSIHSDYPFPTYGPILCKSSRPQDSTQSVYTLTWVSSILLLEW